MRSALPCNSNCTCLVLLLLLLCTVYALCKQDETCRGQLVSTLHAVTALRLATQLLGAGILSCWVKVDYHHHHKVPCVSFSACILQQTHESHTHLQSNVHKVGDYHIIEQAQTSLLPWLVSAPPPPPAQLSVTGINTVTVTVLQQDHINISTMQESIHSQATPGANMAVWLMIITVAIAGQMSF